MLISSQALTILANYLDTFRTPTMIRIQYEITGSTRLGMFTWTAESYKDRAITVG